MILAIGDNTSVVVCVRGHNDFPLDAREIDIVHRDNIYRVCMERGDVLLFDMALPHLGDSRADQATIMNGYVNLTKGICVICNSHAPIKEGPREYEICPNSPICSTCYIAFNGMRFHSYIQRPLRERKPASKFVPGSNDNQLKAPAMYRVSDTTGDQNIMLCCKDTCTECTEATDNTNYTGNNLRRLVVDIEHRKSMCNVPICKLGGDMRIEGLELWKSGLNLSPEVLLKNSS